jgi:hypothetical protein
VPLVYSVMYMGTYVPTYVSYYLTGRVVALGHGLSNFLTFLSEKIDELILHLRLLCFNTLNCLFLQRKGTLAEIVIKMYVLQIGYFNKIREMIAHDSPLCIFAWYLVKRKLNYTLAKFLRKMISRNKKNFKTFSQFQNLLKLFFKGSLPTMKYSFFHGL